MYNLCEDDGRSRALPAGQPELRRGEPHVQHLRPTVHAAQVPAEPPADAPAGRARGVRIVRQELQAAVRPATAQAPRAR